ILASIHPSSLLFLNHHGRDDDMRQVSALVAAGLVFLELSMAIIVAPISPSGPKAIHVEPSSQVQIPSAPIENSPSPSAEVLLWTRQFGSSAFDSGVAVASDPSGVYVAGATGGTLAGETNSGGIDAFLKKSDASGMELWTRQIGSSDEDIAWAVAVNTSSVYLAGSTQATLPGQTTGGGYDAFVLMYNMSGGVQWIRQFGTPSFDIAYGVAAEASAVYVVGYTTGMLPGQPSGGYDAYIRKYDAAGTEEWTRQSGTSGYDEAHAVAVNGT